MEKDIIKNTFPYFGKKGVAKVDRILASEYQKHLIGCLQSGEKALVFEKWL